MGILKEENVTFMITPEQTLSVARQTGLGDADLTLGGVAVLTFSKGVVDRLEELCGLQDAMWISPRHHPYAAAEIAKRGTFEGTSVAALVPPMGASPLSCILEDLVACGVRIVFLVCAAWSLGPPVQFGELIVPSFSLGPDGTSIHYGNDDEEVHADQAVVDALAQACTALGVAHHVGGNGSCEALYRITPEMAAGFRDRGCLCMDNGEASTLFAAARSQRILAGVLFQPYIELARGWDPSRLGNERYRSACRLQAEVVLEASLRLKRKGVLEG